jgi:hypothetical protein
MSGLGWLAAASSLTEAYGLREQGRVARIQAGRQKLYAEFAMWNAERTGALVVAASQRQAAEERRQADLVASRALAVAAASGGGVSDPTVVNIIARTRGEGVYRANVALYEGAERARSMRIEAAGGGDFDASSSIRAGVNAAALGRLSRAGLSLYAKYGLGGPDSGSGGSGDSAVLDAGTRDFSAVA